MTRSIIRRVDWTCAPEPSSPHPIYAFECTTCGEAGQANDLFERARDFVFEHVGRNPSHTGFRETVTRHWRMHGEDVAQAPAPGWVVKPETRAYAEELRASPGTASSDGHAGWQCDAGGGWLVSAGTPGPGKLGTHHGVIYACTEHQAAAVERVTTGGYDVDVQHAPPGHRWNPWPCGHVTAYDAGALAALTTPQAPGGDCPACRGRGARVLPNTSAETECSECDATGRLSPPSRPTPEYGAPYVPTLPAREYAVPVPPTSLGPVDAGAPESTERPY